MIPEYCLCEKCEYFTFKEKFDFKLSLCEICKEEKDDNDSSQDQKAPKSS